MRFAGILEPGFTSGVITYAKYIKGSYIIVESQSERDEILSGVLVNGTHVFIAETGEVQRWDGSEWIEEPSMSISGYLYNGELYRDQEHTDRVQPFKNGLYFDKEKNEPIIYNGYKFVEFLSSYLKASATVAGIGFEESENHPSISTDDLLNALNLKNLSHKNSGTVKVNTIDNISVTYTPSGTIILSDFNQTETSANISYETYIPQGNISNGTTTARGNINVVLGDSDELSDAELTKTTYTPSIQVTHETASVLGSINSDGVAPTYNQGTFDEGSFNSTTSNYNTDAMKMRMPTATEITGDITDETLIIEPASTETAISSATYIPPSHGNDTFTPGSLPTFNTTSVVIDSSAVTTNPTDIVSTVKYKKQVVTSQNFFGEESTVNGMTFEGTPKENAIVTSVTYDKASKNSAAFVGTKETISAVPTQSQKTISVEFHD